MSNNLKVFASASERLSKNPLGIIALFIILVYAVAALVVGFSGSSSIETDQKWPLIWFLTLFPLFVLAVFTVLVTCFHHKLYAPADFKDERLFEQLASWKKERRLEAPQGDQEISYEHVALLHSSWRYPKEDAEYGRPIWAFHIIVVATDEVLDRIECVDYSLDPTYGKQQRQAVQDRKSNFALKQLAWGESIVLATIKIRNQETLIKLNRYINLTETGPRLSTARSSWLTMITLRPPAQYQGRQRVRVSLSIPCSTKS